MIRLVMSCSSLLLAMFGVKGFEPFKLRLAVQAPDNAFYMGLCDLPAGIYVLELKYGAGQNQQVYFTGYFRGVA
jgi:hypothetical protein